MRATKKIIKLTDIHDTYTSNFIIDRILDSLGYEIEETTEYTESDHRFVHTIKKYKLIKKE